MRLASDILREAKALIGTPDTWCQGEMRRGLRLCSLGAIYRASGNDKTAEIPWAFLQQAMSPAPSVGRFNDTHSHAEVMSAFDRAIALALADERKDEPWTIDDTRKAIQEIVSGAERVTA